MRGEQRSGSHIEEKADDAAVFDDVETGGDRS
jgi:hypothetical protein